MTTERYTAVFTGALADRKPGEYLCLTMSGEPSGSGGGHTLHRGRPPYEFLGREVSFDDLPEGCQSLVMGVYRELWDLHE